ncbi:hypothetical protein [Amycolatopsis suaedae]|uniref:Uncharacterized protein n=1 Tax=Amycolatopsis suaedae TaxID=2510978 RepID=A0A4V2ELL4_9PSEU|nr:hypothetical protein [Amycolatopsis suaedae]RZQ61975.1 hypothetical protein EWH70_20420 [Amycolatopsis suaedae]
MRFAGGPSWQIRWGNHHPTNLALFVRDALALSVVTEPVLPPVEPSVPVVVPDGVDRAAVAAQWPGWWAEILAYKNQEPPRDARAGFDNHPAFPHSPAQTRRPELRHAVETLAAPAAEHPWPTRFRDPAGVHDLGALVRDWETGHGRSPRPFVLVITEVPVAGRVWHRLTPSHLLVSTRVVDDWPAYESGLREIVNELA